MKQGNVGASVRERLLNKARADNRPFQELLQYYAMERFLYRLAQSTHVRKFVLKGALLLTAWQAPLSRPTMDIDFAGKTSNDPDHIKVLIDDICGLAVEDDGLRFVKTSIKASRIKEDANYEGVRVRFHGLLASARVPLQSDIGFGDVIVPSVESVKYPALLEFPNPVLIAYPKESVIAEKLEAITSLGLLNSRMKDYFDMWLLSELYQFERAVLTEASKVTFQHRQTAIEPDPVGLSDTFASDPAKDKQWRAFVKRSRFVFAPADLKNAVAKVSAFVGPVLTAAASSHAMSWNWRPGAGWRDQ